LSQLENGLLPEFASRLIRQGFRTKGKLIDYLVRMFIQFGQEYFKDIVCVDIAILDCGIGSAT